MEEVKPKEREENGADFRNSRQYVLYKFKILSNITRPSFGNQNGRKLSSSKNHVGRLFGNGCPIDSHHNPMLALLGAGHHLHHHRSSLQIDLLLAALFYNFKILLWVHTHKHEYVPPYLKTLF
jgi:hypothetical protein